MSIDLEQVVSYGKTAAVGGLSLTFIWTVIWPLIKKWFLSLPKSTPEPVTQHIRDELFVTTVDGTTVSQSTNIQNSDKACPKEFTKHVSVILEASPYALAEVQLTYIKEGLTEAQTLRREVERMGNNLVPFISKQVGGTL